MVADVGFGRYTPSLGWDLKARGEVAAVPDEPAGDDRSAEDDPATFTKHWLSLGDHLADAFEMIVAASDEGLTRFAGVTGHDLGPFGGGEAV